MARWSDLLPLALFLFQKVKNILLFLSSLFTFFSYVFAQKHKKMTLCRAKSEEFSYLFKYGCYVFDFTFLQLYRKNAIVIAKGRNGAIIAPAVDSNT